MGLKRIVDTSFWTDGKVDDFSPEDKYFMLYLLTSPFTSLLGIYEISIKQASFQMGYTVDTVNVLLDRFENKYHMIRFSRDTNEVAILNFLRHSIIKGGKPVKDCMNKEINGVKNKKLIAYVFSHVEKYEGLNETVKEVIAEYKERNGFVDGYGDCDTASGNEDGNDSGNGYGYGVSYPDTPHESSHVSYPDSQNGAYKEIVDYLNKKAGTKYRHTTKKTKDHIHARMAEGFTVDDFKTVIDKKCSEWIGSEMEKYLRPETLFGPKFEGYLNAKCSKPKQSANNRQQQICQSPEEDILEGIF